MWTGRWQNSGALTVAAANVERLPHKIGDWEMIKENQVSDEEKSVAELAGSISRQYRHQHSGDIVTVLLMMGKPGPIAVHPPTACYTGLGYQQVGSTRNQTIEIVNPNGKQRHQFQNAQFTNPKKTETQEPHVFWGWSADGNWSCPDSPRLAFVGKPALFKLYVTYEAGGVVKSKDQTPAEKMLKELIPILSEQVFGRS